MSYRLFYADGSAAMAVRVLLEEIGVDYSLINTVIETGAPRSAEHLAVNPNGWVPVLAWDDQAMHEAAAITIYLTDLFPEAALGPAPQDPDRALYLQTLVYFSNTVQTAFQQVYYPERFAAEAQGHSDAVRRGVRRLHEVWQLVEAQLHGKTWVLGDRFSAADVHLYMLTTWLDEATGHPRLDALPNVERVAKQAAERPSVMRVYGLDGGDSL